MESSKPVAALSTASLGEDGRPLRAAERILQTARRLFYRNGIRAVGVDEIVKQAGVTKPSLYRTFPSKDDLAANYLRRYEAEFWARFDAAVVAHPGNPRAQVLAFFEPIETRSDLPGYRGCGLTNAVVEYPEPDNPARLVAQANKRELRLRLRQLAAEMQAPNPETLGDGLLLLLEGAYATGQIFGRDGPAKALVETADKLIEISLRA
ncbi:MAG TPA: TetR/AcrR family transcriptional regulator [Devosiaceae bacterium]|jgi:AcrR family transcriptional regulator